LGNVQILVLVCVTLSSGYGMKERGMWSRTAEVLKEQ
jgi:hypothetical protein